MAVATAELTSSTVTIDNLPDEVLAEVMLRVPTPAALVHAAAVSKRWRGVIVTPDGKFLHEYRARHKSSPFLGLYIPREYGGLPSFHKADSIQSAATDDDESGDDDDGSGGDADLQRAVDKAFRLNGLKRHQKWRLLDCYNGRLLLTKGDRCLLVYNPLSRERISVDLPQDGILQTNFSACLLQGHGDDASSFRVVSVHRHRGDRTVHAVEYDSCRKSWNHHEDWEIMKKIEGTEQGEVMRAGNLVFCKYTGTCLLVLDTTKMQFYALPLPGDNNPKKYAIGEIEDGVCCLAAVDSVGESNTPYLRVWRLEEQDWMLEKTMEVQQVLGEHAPDGHSYYKVCKVTNGMAVLCWSMRDLHFIIDLKTFCVMEKFEFNYNLPAFPMQLPWPPAFSVATISALNPVAAYEGEAEGTKTDGKSEEEAAETGGENEDVPKDFNTEGDAVEESLPSCRRYLKRAGTPDPTPEDDEAEEPTLLRRCHRQKLGERGHSPPPLPPLPDHLRCRRNDGKKWRCSGRALPTISFCEYHYAKVNKGKKLPAAGKVLAVAHQRQKNKRINPPVATISVMNPAGALGGEAEGAKTDGKSDEEATKTGGENEDAAEDYNEYAHRGEVEGAETDDKSEKEYAKTAGENEDSTEDSDTEGDDVEESPPSRHHRRKRAATPDPTLEDDEAEGIPAPLCRRRRRKLGEHSDSLPDHLRCGRRDGKKWRCSARALPTGSFCEHHYAKANKGKIKKVPADGEVLAVALQRLKNKSINPPAATISVMNPAGALGGKAEGAKTDSKSDEEATKTGGENEDATEDYNEYAHRGEVEGAETDDKSEKEYAKTAGENEESTEDSDTEGDDVEESPPSRHHRRKRAAALDPTLEDDEAEGIPAPLCRRRRRKLGEHGDSLPDHLRCVRRDGKKWRCSARALPTGSFCEHHYAKANKGKIKKVPADGEVLAVALQRLRNKSINPPVATISVMKTKSSEDTKIDFHRQRQLRECGDSPLPLPDHLRCGRRDGKKWRCSRCALPTVSFCEYHYTKAKMGKKLPADGEVLAVACQRLKNKRKGGKKINTTVSPQATTSDCETRDLLNGQGAPCAMSMTKAVPRTCHSCGLTKAAGVANCKNCENNFCNNCINKWYSGISRKDIKTCCPVCRGLCDCKKCTLGQTKGAMHKQ
ncbi:unnamed protein product [Urochloa decumbens]|uniref:F-box domain-containing protein n=1 Tax=Urochloa decumbens TaxID=240449 RepID=A0ABC9FYT9_9POAL